MNSIKLLSIQKLMKCISRYHNIILYSSNTFPKFFSSMSQHEINLELGKYKRITMKKSVGKFHPSNVSLQVLGNGKCGSPSSLYVFTDHFRYLFNCGEGGQRLSHEHRLRLGKLENIFFTSATWKNMGGLPGMSLTVEGMGVTDINLHGPKGIRDIFDAAKRFIVLRKLAVKEIDCRENNCYDDHCMKISYVHLKKTTDNNYSYDNNVGNDDITNYYDYNTNDNGKRNMQKQGPSPTEENVKRRTHNTPKECIAYICKLHEKLGKLNIEKCFDKGLRSGPILGKLKNGSDVTLDDGTVIKNVDVCDPPIPGPVFIVIECPDEDYLDSILKHKAFESFHDGTNVSQWIIHFTPENILRDSRYIEWMTRFGNDTEHLIINENNNGYSHEALYRMQYQLNLIHPKIFPLLPDPSLDFQEDLTEPRILKNLKIHRAETLTRIHLRPSNGLDKSAEIVIDKEECLDEILQIDGLTDALAKLKTQIDVQSESIAKLPEYPKILMLGTGSSLPNKVRNTSGILMRIDENTSVILDCGEGTVGQLLRFFGPSLIDKILYDIKAIYVSHLHADHHLGLIGILQERKKITDEPVFLFAPKPIERWLRLYHNEFEKINDSYILIPNQCIHYDERKVPNDRYDDLKDRLQIDDVCTIDVIHCAYSFAVAWKLKCGKKIVYSGDTRPCSNIIQIGKDCDLLIHEATMEDDLLDEAKKKQHSTLSEALSIATRMNAKFTLLTHFSQRYSKVPRLPDEAKILSNVGIAFDNMQISIAQLPLLPLFYPCLQLMFGEYFNELEEKAFKRNKRNESIVPLKETSRV